jgi:hypothetical protein
MKHTAGSGTADTGSSGDGAGGRGKESLLLLYPLESFTPISECIQSKFLNMTSIIIFYYS